MKFKFLSLALLLFLMIGCASSSASNSADSTSGVEGEASAAPQGMLKAFGLKGKVKTLTLSKEGENGDAFVFAFDPDGNYLKSPDYNGGEARMDAQSDFFFCDITIDGWKWTEMHFSSRGNTDLTYQMTAYDDKNCPIRTTIIIDGDNIVMKDAIITYTGSDSKGNYTQIKIEDGGLDYYPAGTFNVGIEYWPDDTTMADLPKPLTNEVAEKLIKIANRKEPAGLSRAFREFIDVPGVGGDNGFYFFIESIGGPTILDYGESNNVPDIAVHINDIDVADSGDKATVSFHYTEVYDGQYDKSDFEDNDYFYLVECVYEDGSWKVDDFGWDLVYNNFHNYSGETFKNYYKDTRDMYLKDLKSGRTEKVIKENFTDDPDMNTYLKKVADCKKRLNIQ